MKNELKKVLSENNEVDFLELVAALNIAKYAMDILKEFDFGEEELLNKLEVKSDVLKSILWGYYPYDIRIMSKLEAIQHQLEKDRTIKLKKKLIELPDYENSIPIKYLTQFAAMLKKENEKTFP